MAPAVEKVSLPSLPRSERLRSLLVAGILVAGTVFFARIVDVHYPLRHWLFFRYGTAWSLTGVYVLACLVSGWRLLEHVSRSRASLAERLTLAMGLGVLASFCGTFLAGIFGLLGKVFFYVWPILLIGFGAKKAMRDARRTVPRLRRFGVRLFMPVSVGEAAAAAFFLVCLVAVYLQVLLPRNVAADSYWYHLPIAEHYAAAGAIRRFGEGWYVGAYPQLATLVYTWAFLGPGVFFDHVILCSHLEFALFIATLGGVSVLTSRLLRQKRAPFAAAAMFLFPEIFLYDSNVNTGADHVLAFWAPPLAIALIRMGRTFSVQEGLLAGLMLAGAVSTKYQGTYFLLPAALFLAVLIVKNRKVWPVLAAAAAFLIITASHWLKNWIFYQDPLYPLLYKYLPSSPFHTGADELLKTVFWYSYFMPQGTTAEKWASTLSSLATFSFIPNDWPRFHGTKPVFGSLFTLLLPALLFLRAGRRIWLLVVGVHLGIVVWYVTSHQDRYLQALLPWMAAVTAAGLALSWRRQWWVKGPTFLLVVFQIVWGADVYFFRTHALLGDSPIRALAEYMGMAHQGRYEERYRFPESHERIAPRIPPGAKVLVHAWSSKLGLGAESVADGPGWQGAIEYLQHVSPLVTSSLWRKLGVTHLLYPFDRGAIPPVDVAREAVFLRAARASLGPTESIGEWRLKRLDASPTGAEKTDDPTRILWLGCVGNSPPGLYGPEDLAQGSALQEIDVDPAALIVSLEQSNVVVRRSCFSVSDGAFESALRGRFTAICRGGDMTFWVRTDGGVASTRP